MKLPLQSGWRGLIGRVGLAVALLSGTVAQAQQVQTYIFRTANTTFTPITGGTSVAGIQVDDALSAALPIGFTFNFDGANYQQVKASSNGWLTFNTAATANSLTNDLDNGTAAERPRVAPFWDDLNGSTGTASYTTTGTAGSQVFTFQWLNWFRFGGTGPSISFQVQLFEGTNQVRFIYRRESVALPTTTTASIGLSGTGTGANSFVSLSNAVTNPNASSLTESDQITIFPASGQVYQFTPQPTNACGTPRNLTATVSGTTATATVNWQVPSGTGPYTVIYGPTGFDPLSSTGGGTTVGPVTGTTASIPNLTPGSYQFYVSQTCGTGTSNLSSVGGFDVACPTPSGLTVGAVTNTTAAISYTSPVTTGVTFTIVYGPTGTAGFDPNATTPGIIRQTGVTGTSTTLTGLTANTAYTVYVQQVCSGGGTSPAYAGPVSFTTPLLPPANDNPCGAIALASTATSASNVGATTTSISGLSNPGCSPSQVPKDVWFTYVPAANTNAMTLALTGTAAGQVRVFTSPSCSAGPFTQVFCQASTANNTGFNGPLVVPNLVPGTTYYVSVSGFGSSDVTGNFTIAATSVLASRSQLESVALVVYPNPSNTGEISLRLEQAHGAGQIALLNALGQVVSTKDLSSTNSEYTLSTRHLAAGLYTLRVQSNGHILTRKVVLE